MECEAKFAEEEITSAMIEAGLSKLWGFGYSDPAWFDREDMRLILEAALSARRNGAS